MAQNNINTNNYRILEGCGMTPCKSCAGEAWGCHYKKISIDNFGGKLSLEEAQAELKFRKENHAIALELRRESDALA